MKHGNMHGARHWHNCAMLAPTPKPTNPPTTAVAKTPSAGTPHDVARDGVITRFQPGACPGLRVPIRTSDQ
jgi:hypothetical protein